MPVEVTVTRLEPREVRPDSTIVIAATLRNGGSTEAGGLSVRLQRGSRIETRSELAAADTTPPAVSTRFCPSVPLHRTLPPGQSMQVDYQCPAADLRLFGPGVYPVALAVHGVSADGAEGAVGLAQTLLPSFAGVTPAPTRVAWLWPLLDRPHRLTGDAASPPVFADDGLARSVSRGGRLDQLLAAAEAVTGRVRLTLVVDPETIQALRLMARGYRVGTAAQSVAGTGQQAAAAWLARLRRIASHNLLVVVPYGDPDLVALERGHIAALGQPEQSDVDAVDAELGIAATGKLAWPADGQLTDAALDDLVAHGATAVVLDSAALPGGGLDSAPTASAVSPLPALGGQAVALVLDSGLQSVVAQAATYPGGPRLAEQRYLAELAMITAEEPAVARTLVVAPPRRWTPAPEYAGGVLADTGRLSWLTSVTAQQAVASTPPVDRGPLVYPSAATRSELRLAQVQLIGEVQALVTDLRGALTNEDANQLLSVYSDALRRAASSGWRKDPVGGQAYIAALRAEIVRLRGQVAIAVPFTGVYTLASANSPLTLTVVNQLSKPVKIRLQVSSAAVGFRVQDVGMQEIPAGSRRTVRVPAEVQRSGSFAVRVRLTTPAGGSLGSPVTLTVRSTAYGALALGITGVALLVLIGTVAARMVRQLRRRAGSPPRPVDWNLP